MNFRIRRLLKRLLVADRRNARRKIRVIKQRLARLGWTGEAAEVVAPAPVEETPKPKAKAKAKPKKKATKKKEQ